MSSISAAHPLRRALAPALPRARWRSAGIAALLFSTVAWASLPKTDTLATDEQRQWQALGLAPLASGGRTGRDMAPTEAVHSVDFVPERAALVQVQPAHPSVSAPTGPLRIQGRVGDGFYWSLRAAGASPETAAQYLAALATHIDVGEVGRSDGFDLVVGANRELLYAGIMRFGAAPLQLVRWTAAGRTEWIDAAGAEKPAPSYETAAWPVAGRITSHFGYRYHPILRFTRFHSGVDFAAGWGSPIVAAADGQVAAAGWSGGYGRQVRIWHGAGLVTSYSHMSEIVAAPGSYVRRGQLIGYVGSSGLSTGPHLHFEVIRDGTPVDPLSVRLASAGAAATDPRVAEAVKARLKALLSVGAKGA